MKNLNRFIKENKASLIGMLIGLVLGYLYWDHIACYSGTFLLGSECWVNCALGALTGGLMACLLKEPHPEK
ncbi:MAG: hypothetical protein LUG98_13350 [Tannerellaceae bacterium]|nr:hypothetical protein [Tannerellaceae bacterium]